MQMELGVNFRPAAVAALGFNADAIRTLRPMLIRHVVTDPSTLTRWIASAERHHLRILWSVPIERLGLASSMLVIDHLCRGAPHVTGGLELGTAPWRPGVPVSKFLIEALSLAGLARERGLRDCPFLLGIGYEDGNVSAEIWFSQLFRFLQTKALPMERFEALAILGQQPGRPLRRRHLTRFAGRLKRVGLRLALVQVGWPIGMPLRIEWRVRETYRRWEEVRRIVRVLDATSRQHWLLEAYDLARTLEVSHFLLEPEPGEGLPGWGLYHGGRRRADPAWYALQRRHDAHPSP